MTEARAERRSITHISLVMNDFHKGLITCQRFENGRRVILAAVIYDNHFIVGGKGGKYGQGVHNQRYNGLCVIERRKEDRDAVFPLDACHLSHVEEVSVFNHVIAQQPISLSGLGVKSPRGDSQPTRGEFSFVKPPAPARVDAFTEEHASQWDVSFRKCDGKDCVLILALVI